MPETYIFQKSGADYPGTLLREANELGYRTVTLVGPPRRLLGDDDSGEAKVDDSIDYRRVTPLLSPAQMLARPPEDVGWLALSRRSVARLFAYYLIAEDPQRRLDVRPVETLSHQVSLINHVLQTGHLNYLLLADEVGLGKTVEAGLLLQELFSQNPALRVLYLAPARLVSNVFREFERLGLNFRMWTAQDADARLMSDTRIIASIHRAVHSRNQEIMLATPPWDVIIVDEAHHLSAWSPEAGDATRAFSLVRRLIRRDPAPSRFILMTGTPHQGHPQRFENLLSLLRRDEEAEDQLAGRVIYRTKDDISGWDGQPLFPSRQVNPPLVIDLGSAHRQWIQSIHDFYRPPQDGRPRSEAQRRAAGWRCAQAMQWATSSPQAGLGYLVRQAIRAGRTLEDPVLRRALEAMRPYRRGAQDEPVDGLFARILREVDNQRQNATEDDIEEFTEDEAEEFDHAELEQLLLQGVGLVKTAGDDKWKMIDEALLVSIGPEKVVLFAQPIETVTALAGYLQRKTGQRPALIIGGQSDAERTQEVTSFEKLTGPQFLVSSRAGGEGINLQVARRIVHVDVPWNPMDMEQRVGRVHRFGSRETILVDTVVVQNSREADAYATARRKLQVIAETMGGRERFESVYSRVMALVPQDELVELLIRDYTAPLNVADQAALTQMVQRGFDTWREFHDTYSQQQKAIRSQPAGLATWDDVVLFMEKLGGATRREGYVRQSFTRSERAVMPAISGATVLGLKDDRDYIVADYSDALVYGPDKTLLTRKLGLNIGPVAESLRKHAFEYPAGPAYLKWQSKNNQPLGDRPLPLCVLAFLRQTLQAGSRAGWREVGTSLHVFVAGSNRFEELAGSQKADLLRAIFQATVAAKPEEVPETVALLTRTEAELVEQLRQISEDESERQIRHAVMPIFAGVITC